MVSIDWSTYNAPVVSSADSDTPRGSAHVGPEGSVRVSIAIAKSKIVERAGVRGS